jgi:hypothetical protein
VSRTSIAAQEGLDSTAPRWIDGMIWDASASYLHGHPPGPGPGPGPATALADPLRKR